MTTEIVICKACDTQVVGMADGTCPACQKHHLSGMQSLSTTFEQTGPREAKGGYETWLPGIWIPASRNIRLSHDFNRRDRAKSAKRINLAKKVVIEILDDRFIYHKGKDLLTIEWKHVDNLAFGDSIETVFLKLTDGVELELPFNVANSVGENRVKEDAALRFFDSWSFFKLGRTASQIASEMYPTCRCPSCGANSVLVDRSLVTIVFLLVGATVSRKQLIGCRGCLTRSSLKNLFVNAIGCNIFFPFSIFFGILFLAWSVKVRLHYSTQHSPEALRRLALAEFIE